MSFQDYVDDLEPRSKLSQRDKRAVVAIACVAALVLALVCVNMAQGGSGSVQVERASSQESANGETSSERVDSDASDEVAEICVYVTGCVNAPGMLRLAQDARVADAIEAAGGFTEDASTDSINLARMVADGEQIDVKSKEEVAASHLFEQTGSVGADGMSLAQGTSQGHGLVNINTATAEELQTLNGIGKSKAQKIIDHRTKNGPFKKLEDLTKVSGIGDKTFEGLKDAICL